MTRIYIESRDEISVWETKQEDTRDLGSAWYRVKMYADIKQAIQAYPDADIGVGSPYASHGTLKAIV